MTPWPAFPALVPQAASHDGVVVAAKGVEDSSQAGQFLIRLAVDRYAQDQKGLGVALRLSGALSLAVGMCDFWIWPDGSALVVEHSNTYTPIPWVLQVRAEKLGVNAQEVQSLALASPPSLFLEARAWAESLRGCRAGWNTQSLVPVYSSHNNPIVLLHAQQGREAVNTLIQTAHAHVDRWIGGRDSPPTGLLLGVPAPDGTWHEPPRIMPLYDPIPQDAGFEEGGARILRHFLNTNAISPSALAGWRWMMTQEGTHKRGRVVTPLPTPSLSAHARAARIHALSTLV